MTTKTSKKPTITIEDRVKFEAIWNELKLVSHRVHAEKSADDHWFPCGLASISIPKRGKFAQWLLENDLAWEGAGSGITMALYDRNGFATGGQSYDLNVAIKTALRDTLVARGINATMTAWID